MSMLHLEPLRSGRLLLVYRAEIIIALFLIILVFLPILESARVLLMGVISENARSLLELAAEQVLQRRDEVLFIGDKVLKDIALSTSPDILLTKTGGTTGHREQGSNYLSYRLQIPDADIRYSIYVQKATASLAINRSALARAIL